MRARSTADDILVVAPYNAQVAALARAAARRVRVGTVDKFQGQAGAGRHLLDGHLDAARTRRAAWSSSTA